MNFNVIDKKTINLKTVYILISDVFFFIKKMSQNVWATIMPFGHFFFWGSKKLRVTGPNGIMVAQTFCDIFFMKKRHQISIYKQFSD
jgi:hypothetical protein